MSAELNELQNASVGMTVGVIEVAILQPLNYAKNMVQQGRSISMNPKVLYRGVGANCVNMGSCTMIQFSVGGALKNYVQGGSGTKLSSAQEMGCGLGAGMVSALVGSPLELCMIQQQRTGLNVVETLKSVANSNITRGFVGTAIREGLWTVGYLSIPPIVRTHLIESYPETFDSQEKARVPAALLGGLFACYLTHPFDTIKTCMQGDIAREKFRTLRHTGMTLYGESGIPAFYRGATFRYGRMVCAVFIMDTLKELIGPLLYPSAFKK